MVNFESEISFSGYTAPAIVCIFTDIGDKTVRFTTMADNYKKIPEHVLHKINNPMMYLGEIGQGAIFCDDSEDMHTDNVKRAVRCAVCQAKFVGNRCQLCLAQKKAGLSPSKGNENARYN